MSWRNKTKRTVRRQIGKVFNGGSDSRSEGNMQLLCSKQSLPKDSGNCTFTTGIMKAMGNTWVDCLLGLDEPACVLGCCCPRSCRTHCLWERTGTTDGSQKRRRNLSALPSAPPSVTVPIPEVWVKSMKGKGLSAAHSCLNSDLD